MKRLVVFDLETVPDFEAISAAFPDRSNEQELMAAVNEHWKGFPRAYASSIVCIGLAIVYLDAHAAEIKQTDVLWAENEKTLLERFWKLVGSKPNTTLVGWNSRSYDVGGLQWRGLKHRVKPGVKVDRYRYSTFSRDPQVVGSWDLMDYLSDFGSHDRVSLDAASQLIGLPGKGGVKGDQVQEMLARGEKHLVSNYCLRDVLNTWGIGLTCLHVEGEVSEENYATAFEDIKRRIEATYMTSVGKDDSAQVQLDNAENGCDYNAGLASPGPL